MGGIDTGPAVRPAVVAVLDTASRLVAACRTTCAESARIRARSRELIGRHGDPAPGDIGKPPDVTPG